MCKCRDFRIGADMSYPPKIEQLCNNLIKYINDNFAEGDKIPGEPELSKVMQCSSRTLGTALRKLVAKGIVKRSNRGTFVSRKAVEDEPLVVLLPCSDIFSQDIAYSSTVTRYIIDAAVQASLKYQRRVITIPVTDSNDCADINVNRLVDLDENSMIMFSSRWFESLFPLFEEHNCRLAFFNSGEYTNVDSPKVSDCFKLQVGEVEIRFFEKAVPYFKQHGAKNILYAKSEAVLAPRRMDKCFYRTLEKEGINGSVFIWSKKKNFAEWMSELAEKLKEGEYDGLLLAPDPEEFCDLELDFYEYLKIPTSMPILMTESMLLNQKRIAKYAKFMYLPFFEYYLEAAEFLLSGQHGNKIVRAEYQILDINSSENKTNPLTERIKI